MKKPSLWTWLGLGVACAVCCAPLLAPWLAAGAAGIGALAGGRVFGLPTALVICGATLVALAAGIGLWILQRRRKAKVEDCACETSCSVTACKPGAATNPQI